MEILAASKVPFGLIWHLRRSLEWINSDDLDGVCAIDLEPEVDATIAQGTEWYRKGTREGALINAVYCPRLSEYQPARIKIFFKNLYFGIPRIYWLSPVVTLQLAFTLAHEVGHHLIETRGFVLEKGEVVSDTQSEEQLADKYAEYVQNKMGTRWYYRFGACLARVLASWHYAAGRYAWMHQQFAEAAVSWRKCCKVDPTRNDAVYWFWRAIEKRDETAGSNA